MIHADEAPDNPLIVRLSEPGQDRELRAISYINSVLEVFSDRERDRILNYLLARNPGRN